VEAVGSGGEEGDEEDDGECFHCVFEEKYHVLWETLDHSVLEGKERWRDYIVVDGRRARERAVAGIETQRL